MRGDFWKWWETVKEASVARDETQGATLTANLLWQIWKGRNKRIFEEQAIPTPVVIKHAVEE